MNSCNLVQTCQTENKRIKAPGGRKREKINKPKANEKWRDLQGKDKEKKLIPENEKF